MEAEMLLPQVIAQLPAGRFFWVRVDCPRMKPVSKRAAFSKPHGRTLRLSGSVEDRGFPGAGSSFPANPSCASDEGMAAHPP
jgi:hypothetical protein